MFSWFKKPAAAVPSVPVSVQMRELLFGDLPLERWLGDGQNAPWNEFTHVQISLRNGDQQAAIESLRRVADAPDLESRHTLQAWHFLRELGVRPSPAIAKEVLGVVVEVGLPEGLDVLAAYRDHQARYWNWSGKGVVWEAPDNRLDGRIDAVLKTAQTVVDQIAPWEEARPPIVALHMARISFLTPSGLHFGEAPLTVLSQDALAAPFFREATRLMQQMTELVPPQNATASRSSGTT